jgi:hypothetical protein
MIAEAQRLEAMSDPTKAFASRMRVSRMSLGGHLKTGHTWPPQNRPTERDQDKSIYNLTLSTSATFFAI